jgi:hypothetical protein
VATVTADEAETVASVSSATASSTLRHVASTCRSRTWIGVPSWPPSALERRRFRHTPSPASLSPILASMPASVSVTNQLGPWSTTHTTVDSLSSGCQSQFWASRPPAPTTEHSVGPAPARISVRAFSASSAVSGTSAPAAIPASSSPAHSGTRTSPGKTPVSANIRS